MGAIGRHDMKQDIFDLRSARTAEILTEIDATMQNMMGHHVVEIAQG
jgi:hypothetical protein